MTVQSIIGLEIHCQLATRTKIFCGCRVRYLDAPNRHTCPVCLGWPGALPVLNHRAVDFAIRAALALRCTVHERSVFARKSYFYPDLPKGYQITQYDQPLATHGRLTFDMGAESRTVSIQRIHLEEDAGKMVRDLEAAGGDLLVDFNRAGVPLIEIVTGPDLCSGAEARACFKAIHRIVTRLGICGGNLELGHMRCDANISVQVPGKPRGGRVEIKNVNSFRFLEQAIDAEVARQTKRLEAGKTVVRETRLWDPRAGRSVPMRDKEQADEYRYFPEPDLPPLVVTRDQIEQIRRQLPELPRDRAHRLMEEHGLSRQQAWVLAESAVLGRFYDQTVAICRRPRDVAKWVTGELLAAFKHAREAGALRITPGQLARIVTLVAVGEISVHAARRVFAITCRTGADPDRVVAEQGLALIASRSRLLPLVEQVLDDHPDRVAQYRDGKTKVLGFLVGKVLMASQGRADPRLTRELLEACLQREPGE